MIPSDTAAETPGAESVVTSIDVLNSLLRGEVAAAETYDMVIEKFDGQAQAVELQRIRDEHTETAAVLRERVRHIGGEPAEGSGAWGAVAAAVTGTAKLLGPATALGALKQGEEYGIGQYENALADPEIDQDAKDLIRFRLIPRCEKHVNDLNRMISAVERQS